MTFEISKDRIVFPQPGRLLTDGDAFKLLDRSMKYPIVVERGISDVFVIGTFDPPGGVAFNVPIGKIFFSKTYDRIPYLDVLRVNQNRGGSGYYVNPMSSQNVYDQWFTSFNIEKDGFTFDFGNFFGEPRSTPSGRFDFRLYWNVYDMDYLGSAL